MMIYDLFCRRRMVHMITSTIE